MTVSEEIYGKSKRQSKNYAQNKMKDIQKRVGNALLHELSNQLVKQDKRKKKIQTTLTAFNFQNKWHKTSSKLNSMSSLQFQKRQKEERKKVLKKIEQRKIEKNKKIFL